MPRKISRVPPRNEKLGAMCVTPVIRYWLDINAARAHIANDPGLIGSSLGAHYLGENVAESFI